MRVQRREEGKGKEDNEHTSVPRTTHSVANVEAFLYSFAQGNDVSDQLMARNSWPSIWEMALLQCCIAMTDPAGKNLNEQLARPGLLQVDLFQNDILSRASYDSSFVCIG